MPSVARFEASRTMPQVYAWDFRGRDIPLGRSRRWIRAGLIPGATAESAVRAHTSAPGGPTAKHNGCAGEALGLVYILFRFHPCVVHQLSCCLAKITLHHCLEL